MSKRNARRPSGAQIAKWRQAEAARKAAQRGRRGQRQNGMPPIHGAGMVRLPPRQDHPASDALGLTTTGRPPGHNGRVAATLSEGIIPHYEQEKEAK